MNAVGYDMYCKLLSEAVKHQKGEEVAEDIDVAVELNVDAFIPDSYIVGENQKIDIYKRISCITSKDEADDMSDELTDRFGSIPASVENLLKVACLRTAAKSVYVTKIKQTGSGIEFYVPPDAKFSPEAIAPFIAGYKGRVKLITGPKPCFIYRFGKDADTSSGSLLTLSLKMCEEMKALL